MTSADTTRRLRAICAEVGFDLDRVKPSVLDRMRLLAQHSQTVTDFERMAATARELFRYYEKTKPIAAFSDVERRIVVLGCLFSDIGKTGPGSADPSAQRLIVEMFSVEDVRDEAQSVTRFMGRYFPGRADERIERFVALGLDPRMRIRDFWNLHTAWTLEIVEFCGVPPEAVAAAATHHLLDGINPMAMVAPNHRFRRSFGENAIFDRAEKLVVVLDKYDAVRRRGRRSHDQAIAWLRDRVAKNPDFRGDVELATLIADLDAMVPASAAVSVG